MFYVHRSLFIMTCSTEKNVLFMNKLKLFLHIQLVRRFQIKKIQQVLKKDQWKNYLHINLNVVGKSR